MLEDYKKMYAESASYIPDYKKLSRNELANKYLETKDTPIAESYLSALILSFWNVIQHNFNTKTAASVTEDDAYTWVVSGILAALDEHAWLNESSSLYNDPKGPEKAINVKCFQNKCRYYQLLQMDKRKISKDNLSLEAISEDTSDSYFLPTQDAGKIDNLLLKEYISTFFARKEYLKFFIVDSIINGDAYTSDGLDEFKLRKNIRLLSNKYCRTLASEYNLKYDDIITAINYFNSLTTSELTIRTERVLKELSHDKVFLKFLTE